VRQPPQKGARERPPKRPAERDPEPILVPQSTRRPVSRLRKRVQQVLRVIKESFQYVIVDAASVLNDITLAALDLSDEILLVTNLDVPSLRNAKLCLDTMRDLHYETDKVKVIIGGAPVTQRFADEIGADIYAADASSAARKAKEAVA